MLDRASRFGGSPLVNEVPRTAGIGPMADRVFGLDATPLDAIGGYTTAAMPPRRRGLRHLANVSPVGGPQGLRLSQVASPGPTCTWTIMTIRVVVADAPASWCAEAVCGMVDGEDDSR